MVSEEITSHALPDYQAEVEFSITAPLLHQSTIDPSCSQFTVSPISTMIMQCWNRDQDYPIPSPLIRRRKNGC